MWQKTTEKPVVLVFQILEDTAPAFLSISDIITKLFENHGINAKVQTVNDYIKQLQCTNSAIISRIERRGKTNLPITVYSILKT